MASAEHLQRQGLQRLGSHSTSDGGMSKHQLCCRRFELIRSEKQQLWIALDSSDPLPPDIGIPAVQTARGVVDMLEERFDYPRRSQHLLQIYRQSDAPGDWTEGSGFEGTTLTTTKWRKGFQRTISPE